MKTIQLAPKKDFLDRVGSASPIRAVSELIWNGLDAGANNINVEFKFNGLGALNEIVVNDDGCGIDAGQVEVMFGGIGESWKRSQSRYHGRALHGKNGEGRFKAFSLGALIKWDTVFSDAGTCKCYEIVGKSNPYSFDYTSPEQVSGVPRTTVSVMNLKEKGLGSLYADSALFEFAKIFAQYLLKNPGVNLKINGSELHPREYCTPIFTATLREFRNKDGKVYPVQLEILEWNQPVERGISLCDSTGIELHSVEAKLRAKDVNFTVLVKSDYFTELSKENRLILEDLDPDVDRIVAEARDSARGYFRARKADELANIVAQWKADDIYPYEEKDSLSPVEIAERQVFDIIGVNIEDYLPQFEEADKAQRKFTFRLLAQAITNNPESLQKIITEVLNLKKEDQDDLADLLKKTNLTNIIRSAKTVADRLNFLEGLKNLLFDRETKKSLLERDQLHQILQREAWIFDENFALTVSEATLNEVLNLHRGLLGKRSDDESEVKRENGGQGRVDLMFSLANKPREGETDHLIVELKRPSKKIDAEVLQQIQSYAFAVSSDPRFDKQTTHWKFVAVSDDLDPFVEQQAHQKDRPEGQVFVDNDNHVEIWAMRWTKIIHDAETRLEFINQALSYDADRDSSRDFLLKKYERFIPKSSKETKTKPISGSIEE